MKKVKLSIVMDADNPYEKEVLKIFSEIAEPKAQQEFLVSAILYYRKSPSYLTQLKLESFLDQIKNVTDLSVDKIKSCIESLEIPINPTSEKQIPEDPILFPDPPFKGRNFHATNKPIDDGASDIFKQLKEEAF